MKPPPRETKVVRMRRGGKAFRAHPLETAEQRDTVDKSLQFHELRLGAIDQEYRHAIDAAETEWENAEFEFGELNARLDRHPSCWPAPFSWLYWVGLIGLAAAEVPITWLSFEYFGDTSTNAVQLALLIGVLLVSLAHLLGLTARQFSHASASVGGAITASACLVLLALALYLLCYGVAILRQGFFEQFAQQKHSLSALLANDAISDAAAALRTSLGPEGLFFLLVKLLVVVVVSLFSFLRHDPHPNYEALDRRRRRTQAAYLAIHRKVDSELAAERRRFAAEARRKGWRITEEG